MTTASAGASSGPVLSTVIVSRNAREELLACIGSIHEHTRSVSFEVILIDNGSTDRSAEAVLRVFPDVRVVENPENVGFARGCNQGMALARGAFILLLNSDAYICDDVLWRCVAALAARTEIGMLGCEVRFPDGRRQHTANCALGIRQSLFRATLALQGASAPTSCAHYWAAIGKARGCRTNPAAASRFVRT